MLNPDEVKTVLETALLSAQDPLPLASLTKLFDEEMGVETVRVLLDELREQWAGRGVELVSLASGWRFQTRPQMQKYLDRINGEKAPRYSRAVLETLAIIAYKQPVTRGDIEDIRGVTVSPNVIKTLEARGWIDVVGHRDTPGKPALYATTKRFLDDLSLRSLQELPPLEEIRQTLDTAAPATASLDAQVDGFARVAESNDTEPAQPIERIQADELDRADAIEPLDAPPDPPEAVADGLDRGPAQREPEAEQPGAFDQPDTLRRAAAEA